MKVYKVKVNGKVYEVELESVNESAQSIVAPEKTSVASQDVQSASFKASGSETELKAPMAGLILDVKAKVSQEVKVGDVVCILEAMKLENEIVANADGVIKEVFVSKGSSVELDQLLVVIG